MYDVMLILWIKYSHCCIINIKIIIHLTGKNSSGFRNFVEEEQENELKMEFSWLNVI